MWHLFNFILKTTFVCPKSATFLQFIVCSYECILYVGYVTISFEGLTFCKFAMPLNVRITFIFNCLHALIPNFKFWSIYVPVLVITHRMGPPHLRPLSDCCLSDGSQLHWNLKLCCLLSIMSLWMNWSSTNGSLFTSESTVNILWSVYIALDRACYHISINNRFN